MKSGNFENPKLSQKEKTDILGILRILIERPYAACICRAAQGLFALYWH